MIKTPKVAIVHDYLRTFGGAERVLLALNKIFPQAKIFMATADFRRMGRFGYLFEKMRISTSWVQKLPFFVKKPLLYRPLLPLVWGTMDIGNADIVISSSGANIAKAIRIPDSAVHICYCHTPPRYLYGLETETNYAKLPILGIFIKLIIKYLRIYDLKTNNKVDHFIANSITVQKRIRKFYKRNSILIYPVSGILNKNKRLIQINKSSKRNSKEFYLVVSRLVSYKHLEIVVRAFNLLGHPLTIVGDGPEKNKLRTMAKKNVRFLGALSDINLMEIYKVCKALIVSTPDEDFGLTPVEAQSFGKPVIAYNSGGLRESIINGKTGILFNELNEDGIVEAVKKFEKTKFKPLDCYINSLRFSEKVFSDKIMGIVEKSLKKRRA
jgi:glycosyltransferase involved in cell wall biosynthesis